MSSKSALRLVLISVPLFTFSAVIADDTVALFPKWVKGHTTYVEWQMDSRFVWTPDEDPGHRSITKRFLVLGLLHEVESLFPNGGARVRLTVERLAFAEDDQEERIWYDTDVGGGEDRSSPFVETFHSLLGQSVMIEFDDTGRVTALTGLDALAQMVESRPDEHGHIGAATYWLEEQCFRFLWAQFYSRYAFKEVRVGDTWSRELESQWGRYRFEYRLKRVGAGDNGTPVAAVTYVVDPVKLPVVPSEDGRGRYEVVESRVRGTALFDIGGGEWIRAHESGESKVKTTHTDPDSGEVYTGGARTSSTEKLLVLTKAQRRAQCDQSGSAQGSSPAPARADGHADRP